MRSSNNCRSRTNAVRSLRHLRARGAFSLQLTAKHKVATPVNWKHGEDVIIAGSVTDDDARKTYPQGWKAPRPYIRIVPQPRD
jgi:hypothetical protein